MVYTATFANLPAVPKESGKKKTPAKNTGFTMTYGSLPTVPIHHDVLQDLKNVGRKVVDGLEHFGKNVADTGAGLVSHPESTLKNLAEGAGATVEDKLLPVAEHGVEDLMFPWKHNLHSQLVANSEHLISHATPRYTPSAPTAPATELGESLPYFVPGAKAADVVDATTAMLAHELPESLAKNAAVNIAKHVASQAGAGATVSALSGESPLQGAEYGALLGGLSYPLGATMRKVLGPRHSAAEMQAISEAAPKGAPVTLGAVSGNPVLKAASALADAFPLSGARRAYAKGHEAIKSQLAHALEGGTEAADPNQHLFDQLTQHYENLKANTHTQYENLKNLMSKEKRPVNHSILRQAIEPVLKDYKARLAKADAKKTGHEVYGPVIKLLSDFMPSKAKPHTFNDLVAAKIMDEFGSPEEKADFANQFGESPNSYSALDTKRKLINAKLRDIDKARQPELHRAATIIKNGIDKTIEAHTKDSPELKRAHDRAQAARRKQGEMETLSYKSGSKTPFFKHYIAQTDPMNLISQYVKPKGARGEDYAALTKKLTDHLSDADKRLVANVLTHGKSEGETGSLHQQIKNLERYSPAQRKELFGKHAEDIDKILAYTKAHPNVVRLPDSFLKKLKDYRGAREVIAGLMGIGLLKFAPQLIAPAVSSTALAAGLSRALRSPALRNLYIKGLPKYAKVPKAALTTAVAGGS